MGHPQRTRKFLETRSLNPGEVRVRICKGDVLLYTKIGYARDGKASVEYMGKRHEATRWGQTWRLDVEKIVEEETEPDEPKYPYGHVLWSLKP
jgi:hypothetical protein